MPENIIPTELVSILLAMSASIALIVSSVIDLQKRILPDGLTLLFFLCGIAFHIINDFSYIPLNSSILGMFAAFALLYGLRFVANHVYKQDTLGLGDVKLMSAAGFWLGLEGVFLSLTIGALLSLTHGLIHAGIIHLKEKDHIELGTFGVPAGPGLSLGIIIVGFWQFYL